MGVKEALKNIRETEALEHIAERLDSIDQRLERLEKALSSKTGKTVKKDEEKPGSDNESEPAG
ncbi:hypothetical protein ADN00_15720 [Ornatilinea apprima]|uniref:Uncharacterized protein n=1 Tax=Ornatilinea apprima TaxID=1134406 RepID=A0A0P6WQD0_9CHLR|nr:hypothetical protein [Ornatilinea apprima]KPL72264.1 hypothetical protein ADN00_15720 [Ornatilinea apprima]